MSSPSIPDRQQQLRAVRQRYDALPAGDRAILRRCKDEGEIRLEGAYWRVVGDAKDVEYALATAVLLFPLAPHQTKQGFSFGRFLRQHLTSSEEGAALRVRRVVQADRDELGHRLRGLLKLASGGEKAVDWGVLGTDIVYFGDVVRRRWTQDFFAPLAPTSAATPST